MICQFLLSTHQIQIFKNIFKDIKMFMEALFIKLKAGNDPNIHEQRIGKGKKMWYIQTMEYYSTLKMNELLLIDTPIWMNDKNITLCKRNWR